MNTDFKPLAWYKLIWKRITLTLYRWRYPENVWYGGGLKRKTALRSVGAGWAPLINKLYDAKPRGTHVTQVKEKYAGLRFYISSGPEWYWDLIGCMEDESYKTCEICGEVGKERVRHGWYKTVCDKHAEEEGYTDLVPREEEYKEDK